MNRKNFSGHHIMLTSAAKIQGQRSGLELGLGLGLGLGLNFLEFRYEGSLFPGRFPPLFGVIYIVSCGIRK